MGFFSPTVQETVKKKKNEVDFTFIFRRSACWLVVPLFIYSEWFQALMCSVTFSSFDAGGKMQKDLFCPLWD